MSAKEYTFSIVFVSLMIILHLCLLADLSTVKTSVMMILGGIQ